MKRVIFIGQAMPRAKRDLHDWPSLNKWLYSIGLTDDEIKSNFYYSALVDYFPGSNGSSHKVPTFDEILKERKRLTKTINDFSPDIVVCIGKLSLSYCLQTKIDKLDKFIGCKFYNNPYGLYKENTLIIPLPHPSGASTWHKKKENIILLNKSLELLKNNLI